MYEGVPPDCVTDAVPVEPLKQSTCVCPEMDEVRVVGCVMVTEAVVLQLFASLTVTVYVPAVRFVAVEVVWPFDHKYV